MAMTTVIVMLMIVTPPPDTWLVTQLNDHCYSYLDFCVDHFTIQAIEKYSAAMYYLTRGHGRFGARCLTRHPTRLLWRRLTRRAPENDHNDDW